MSSRPVDELLTRLLRKRKYVDRNWSPVASTAQQTALMPQDYILRLIEQVTRMLASILALRKAGRDAEAAKEIEVVCLETVGLPFNLVRRSSPETLLQLLASGGGTQHVRAVMLAELLLQDAELSDAAGKRRDATISRAQAHSLLAHSIDFLSPDEQAVYRAKLEALGTAIRKGG
jgi:hypothetical protein